MASIMAASVPTAQPSGSTLSTAKATGTAHHAKDGRGDVSAAQSSTVEPVHATSHPVRPRASGRTA